MNGKAKKFRKKLICAGIIILAIAGCATQARAAAVTTLYEFIPNQSTLVRAGDFGGFYEIYNIEGQFQLTVDFDAGVALFDHVDATYGDEWSLGDLFNMTELYGSVISDTAINFEGQTKDVPFDIHLEMTFVDNLVYMIGGFEEDVPDGYGYYLDAVAIPEPATLFLVGIGVLMLRKRN